MEKAESGLESSFVIQLAAPGFGRASRASSRAALCFTGANDSNQSAAGPAFQSGWLGSARLGLVMVCLCVSEDKERMETAGGPELHRPALVPALQRLLCGHGEHLDGCQHQLLPGHGLKEPPSELLEPPPHLQQLSRAFNPHQSDQSAAQLTGSSLCPLT